MQPSGQKIAQWRIVRRRGAEAPLGPWAVAAVARWLHPWVADALPRDAWHRKARPGHGHPWNLPAGCSVKDSLCPPLHGLMTAGIKTDTAVKWHVCWLAELTVGMPGPIFPSWNQT